MRFSCSFSIVDMAESILEETTAFFWGGEVFFFSELGTEPRALRFLGKHSTTELNPQPRNYCF